jgi:hypothetical protein
MAAATVIHFGRDESDRMEALQDVGIEVLESDSLDRLRMHFGREADVHAVLVSEETPECAEEVAAFVQRHSPAPVILLRCSEAALDESRFDRVYAPHKAMPFWVLEMAVVIEQFRMSLAQSRALIEESKAVYRDTEWQLARARVQMRRDADREGPWKLDGDEEEELPRAQHG